jgi:hypothetical protein
MSSISVQVIQRGAQIPATGTTTKVAVFDSSGAEQDFSLDGTESPVGFIPEVDVAAGPGTVQISDIAADGTVIGTPVVVPYNTVVSTRAASSGATVKVTAP